MRIPFAKEEELKQRAKDAIAVARKRGSNADFQILPRRRLDLVGAMESQVRLRHSFLGRY
jgi:hypothetical protein